MVATSRAASRAVTPANTSIKQAMQGLLGQSIDSTGENSESLKNNNNNSNSYSSNITKSKINNFDITQLSAALQAVSGFALTESDLAIVTTTTTDRVNNNNNTASGSSSDNIMRHENTTTATMETTNRAYIADTTAALLDHLPVEKHAKELNERTTIMFHSSRRMLEEWTGRPVQYHYEVV